MLVAATLALAAVPAYAAVSSPVQARLGFAGLLKIGVPLPLDVVVPPLDVSGPAELTVDAPALGPGAGRVSTSTVAAFRAVPGAEQALHLTVEVSDPRHPLTLRITAQGRGAARAEIPLSPDNIADRLVVAVSRDRAGLASLRRLSMPIHAAYVDGQALPRRWQEYAAVDLLVIRDLPPSALDESQVDALRTWVALGGRLLLIGNAGAGISPLLDGILPASSGGALAMRRLDARRFPPQPIALFPLSAKAGSHTVTSGAVLVAAWQEVGLGRVTVSGIDPWQAPFLAWEGRLRWWDALVPAGSASPIDASNVAEKLPVSTPLDPVSHAEAGAAILLYIGAVLSAPRWRSGRGGWLTAGLVVPVALLIFTHLAGAIRSASTTLTQLSVIEPIPGFPARELALAAVAVPYGGGYQIAVPPQMTVAPVSPAGTLRIAVTPSRTIVAGSLRPGEPARVFEAEGVVPFAASGFLSDGGRRLRTSLGAGPLRQVEVRAGGRVYRIGTLGSGVRTTELYPDRWSPASDPGTPETLFQLALAASRGFETGVILGNTTPVLLGEIVDAEPPFASAVRGSRPGPRVALLLMPLGWR